MMKETEMKRVPKLRFPEFTDDWEQRKLGEIYTERNERGNDNLEILSVSIHHGVSSGELDSNVLGKNVKRSEDKSLYKHVYEGDLVFNMMRAWQGAIGIVKNEGRISPAYISAIPNKNVYSKFMDYCLRRDEVINQINNLSYGVTDFRKRLYWNGFAKVNIMLPSVQEQDKLTELFHNLDKFITLQQRKIKNLKSLKKGMMQKLFNQEVRFKADDGSEFPEWEKKPFGDVVSEFKVKTKVEDEDTLLSCAINGMFLNSELFGHQRGQSNIGYLKIKKGTLILSAQNLHLGNANVNLRFEHGIISPAYKTYDIVGCLAEYMSQWAKWDMTKQFFYNATTVGASECRRNVDWNMLYSQLFAVPCLAEQQKIADCLSSLDEVIEKQKETLAAWEELKKGLLQQMFV